MSNILDKKDKSLYTAFGGVAVSKVERFNWRAVGKKGQFSQISKHLLNIDGRYQREQVRPLKVLEIAKNWDWAMLGSISVVQRDDGSYWVFDGGHRTRAAFYRDEIDELPCMVFKFSDLSEEAKVFLGKNLMTTTVNAIDKFKASVCAEDENALATKELIKSFGLKVSRKATKSTDVKCIKTVQEMVAENHDLARRCVGFVLQVADGEPLSASCLRGLFALCQHFSGRVDILAKYGEKLSRYSQKEMEVRMRQMKAECGKGGAKIEALAIMDLINKGKRNKLSWQADD